MLRYLWLAAVTVAVVNSQWWNAAYRFGGNIGYAPSVGSFGYAAPSVGFQRASAITAGVNRGYALTSTIDGAGDAVMVRRAYGPRTGFQPDEFQDMKGCAPGYCFNNGRCPFEGRAANMDVGGCMCPYGFTGKQCEVAQGTVQIARSGARAPQNLFECNDDGESLLNDCKEKWYSNGVGVNDKWLFPHKRYNNVYVQCAQNKRCFTRVCPRFMEFNPMTQTCMECDREGADGCFAVQNAVRAVSPNVASAAIPMAGGTNMVPASPVAARPVGAAVPVRTYNFGRAFPFNVAYNG